jgi:hypothetical protein
MSYRKSRENAPKATYAGQKPSAENILILKETGRSRVNITSAENTLTNISNDGKETTCPVFNETADSMYISIAVEETVGANRPKKSAERTPKLRALRREAIAKIGSTRRARGDDRNANTATALSTTTVRLPLKEL